MSGKQITNVLLAGVGGQGVLVASETLALAALAEGLQVKQSEVHGVAQRGGSVASHVRVRDLNQIFGSILNFPGEPRAMMLMLNAPGCDDEDNALHGCSLPCGR